MGSKEGVLPPDDERQVILRRISLFEHVASETRQMILERNERMDGDQWISDDLKLLGMLSSNMAHFARLLDESYRRELNQLLSNDDNKLPIMPQVVEHDSDIGVMQKTTEEGGKEFGAWNGDRYYFENGSWVGRVTGTVIEIFSNHRSPSEAISFDEFHNEVLMRLEGVPDEERKTLLGNDFSYCISQADKAFKKIGHRIRKDLPYKGDTNAALRLYVEEYQPKSPQIQIDRSGPDKLRFDSSVVIKGGSSLRQIRGLSGEVVRILQENSSEENPLTFQDIVDIINKKLEENGSTNTTDEDRIRSIITATEKIFRDENLGVSVVREWKINDNNQSQITGVFLKVDEDTEITTVNNVSSKKQGNQEDKVDQIEIIKLSGSVDVGFNGKSVVITEEGRAIEFRGISGTIIYILSKHYTRQSEVDLESLKSEVKLLIPDYVPTFTFENKLRTYIDQVNRRLVRGGFRLRLRTNRKGKQISGMSMDLRDALGEKDEVDKPISTEEKPIEEGVLTSSTEELTGFSRSEIVADVSDIDLQISVLKERHEKIISDIQSLRGKLRSLDNPYGTEADAIKRSILKLQEEDNILIQDKIPDLKRQLN